MINSSFDHILQEADRLSQTELINLIQALLERLKAPVPGTLQQTSEHPLSNQQTDWSSFIGRFEAEADLSVNHKQYL
ncbi:MAG: hypothetical protein ACO3NK_13180 [Prochlorotrichaceae cyanobacterium]|jgi:hypothetical protein